MLHITPNHLSKFKIKNWVEVNYESRGTYDKDNQIRFKTSVLGSSLCNYSDAYIFVKGTITVADTSPHFAPFTNCISRRNIAQVDDAHDTGV